MEMLTSKISADLSLKGDRRVGKSLPNLPNPLLTRADFTPGLPWKTWRLLPRPFSELAPLFGEVFKGFWDDFQ